MCCPSLIFFLAPDLLYLPTHFLGRNPEIQERSRGEQNLKNSSTLKNEQGLMSMKKLDPCKTRSNHTSTKKRNLYKHAAALIFPWYFKSD